MNMKLPGWLVVLFLCLFIGPLSGQFRQPYVWLMGYQSSEPHTDYGGVLLNFLPNEVSLVKTDLNCWLVGQTILNDLGGNIELYSDGCAIYNNTHALVNNGDSINYTAAWRNCPDYGYLTVQGNVLLSMPGNDSMAVLVHLRVHDDLQSIDVLSTILRQNPEGWSVQEKNTLITTLSSPSEYLAAVRHGNGRDWWIIVPEGRSNNFVRILLRTDGIHLVATQSIGRALGWSFSAGQITFTTNGTRLIRFTPGNGLDIYDFDRCTGLLSNPIHGPIMNISAGGCAVSPDSRFLYIPNSTELYQYDLTSQDILLSQELIGEYDGFRDPFSTTFYQAALAPDGKIYITATNGVKSMHVIHHPNRKGKACEFRQHDLHLPVHVDITVPNFPNYLIGPIDGSDCDTLGIDNVPMAEFRYEFDSLDERVVHFRNTSTFKPTDYYWTFGDGHASRDFEQDHLYYRSSTYRVCLTASNHYGSDTFCRDVPIILSQQYNPIELPEFTIAPNPVRDYLRVSFGSDLTDELEFELFDNQGKLIRVDKLQKEILDHYLDFSKFLPGMYLYRITNNELKIYSGKIIKL